MSLRATDFGTFQQTVKNDVLFQSTDVEAAFHKQVSHATRVVASLEKRLFALQAEAQQCKDVSRAAMTVATEIRQARASTPRLSSETMSPRALAAAASSGDPALVDSAISAVTSAIDSLAALQNEMSAVEGIIIVQLKWLRELINRDSDCLSSVSCRKNRALEYKNNGGVQLSSDMSPTQWPEQANQSFLAAGDVMKRSAAARKMVFDVCKAGQLTAARVKKAAMDTIARSVTEQLDQRHDLRCKLESVEKRAHDTEKALGSARTDLNDLKTPLKVALAREIARHKTDDAVGEALKHEKATVVRGYRQLRHLTRQLESDLSDLHANQASLRKELQVIDSNIAIENDAMMSQSALRVANSLQQSPRSAIRTFYHQAPDGTYTERVQTAPNPITWDANAPAPQELRLSLWNNLRARQQPGQRRDPKKKDGKPDHSTSPRKVHHVPKPPPKTAAPRATG